MEILKSLACKVRNCFKWFISFWIVKILFILFISPIFLFILLIVQIVSVPYTTVVFILVIIGECKGLELYLPLWSRHLNSWRLEKWASVRYGECIKQRYHGDEPVVFDYLRGYPFDSEIYDLKPVFFSIIKTPLLFTKKGVPLFTKRVLFPLINKNRISSVNLAYVEIPFWKKNLLRLLQNFDSNLFLEETIFIVKEGEELGEEEELVKGREVVVIYRLMS